VREGREIPVVLKTNKFGIVGWQRPSKADMTPCMYIGKEKP
jgi:hypothetical protein